MSLGTVKIRYTSFPPGRWLKRILMTYQRPILEPELGRGRIELRKELSQRPRSLELGHIQVVPGRRKEELRSLGPRLLWRSQDSHEDQQKLNRRKMQQL